MRGHKRADCAASAAEKAAHTARVEARKAEKTAARAKAGTGVPRESSRKPPQCRACRAMGHTSGSRVCPKSQRASGAATAYTGDPDVNASAPGPYALGAQKVYATTLVPLRVLFERHQVRRGWRPRRRVAGGRPSMRVRFVKRDAGAAAASARLQRKLGAVAKVETKHRMVIVKALGGAPRRIRVDAGGDVRAFMDSFPVDDVTDDKGCAWKWMAAVMSCRGAYQCGRSADPRKSCGCKSDDQRSAPDVNMAPEVGFCGAFVDAAAALCAATTPPCTNNLQAPFDSAAYTAVATTTAKAVARAVPRAVKQLAGVIVADALAVAALTDTVSDLPEWRGVEAHAVAKAAAALRHANACHGRVCQVVGRGALGRCRWRHLGRMGVGVCVRCSSWVGNVGGVSVSVGGERWVRVLVRSVALLAFQARVVAA